MATTIEAVAAAADVAVQTVYYVFGTKRNLLGAVLDAQIAGDLDTTPLVDRPWIDALAQAPDASSAVGILVESAVAIIARASPMYEVVRRAAADPEVGDLLAANRRAGAPTNAGSWRSSAIRASSLEGSTSTSSPTSSTPS